MVYLLLGIVCSSGVTLMMRFGEKRCKNKYSMLEGNYIACILLAFCFMKDRNIFPAGGSRSALAFGAVNGVLFLAALVLCQMSIRKNGPILTSTFSKLGILIPTLMSVFLFKERPRVLQVAGILLALAAIVLIQFEKNTGEAGFKTGLVLLLIAGGAADGMSKVFEQLGERKYDDHFLFYTFLMAGLLCLLLIWKEKEKIQLSDLWCGLLVGIPNYLSTRFLLKALADIPAYLTYPIYSVGTIAVVSLVSMTVYQDKLSKRQYAGIGVVMTALILLNVA